MSPVEFLVIAYVWPLYNFVQCFTGVCAPVTWPWG